MVDRREINREAGDAAEVWWKSGQCPVNYYDVTETIYRASFAGGAEWERKNHAEVCGNEFNHVIILKERIQKLTNALRFYAGQEWSNIELDAFDYFKCDCGTSATKHFDSDKFCETARDALKENKP